MQIVEKSIFIQRPIEEVFAFHADSSNRVDWHDHVISSDLLGDQALGLGACFIIVNKSFGRTVTMLQEITSYDPPHRYCYEVLTGPANVESCQRFESQDGGTLYTSTIYISLKGLLKPFTGLLVRWWFDQHAEKAAEEFKEVMENG